MHKDDSSTHSGEGASPDAGVGVRLTEAQIEKGWRDTFSTNNPFCPCDLRSFTKAARWAETAMQQRQAKLILALQTVTDLYAKAMKDAGVSYYPEALVEVRNARTAIASATKGATS